MQIGQLNLRKLKFLSAQKVFKSRPKSFMLKTNKSTDIFFGGFPHSFSFYLFLETMQARRILIGYDHSKVSNEAMEWIVEKRILYPEDIVTLAIIVNDDAIAVEGTFGLESAVVGPTGWLADDYVERVSKLEKESVEALKSVVKWFANKGVSYRSSLSPF